MDSTREVSSQVPVKSEQPWIESEAIKDEVETEYQDGAWVDLFADPDPRETFHFNFNIEENAVVHVSLQGYKAELGQTLHSTGLTLWRASSMLCDFLLHNRHVVQGRTVVELGAGLGLCGILSKHLGAAKVVLTDGDTDTLANLRFNIERNGVDADVEQLIWGESQRWEFGVFDTVLGSDVVYVEEMLEPLWSTVNGILAPNGSFLLAFTRRNVSVDLVLQKAEKYDFSWLQNEVEEGVIIFRRHSAP